MAFGIKNSTRILDPKLCYELFLRTGSVYKVPAVLKNEYGIYQEKTGQLITAQAVWLAVGNYVINNLNETREGFDKVWMANGQIPTDTDWYKFVLSKVKYLSRKKREKFLKEHSYMVSFQK